MGGPGGASDDAIRCEKTLFTNERIKSAFKMGRRLQA